MDDYCEQIRMSQDDQAFGTIVMQSWEEAKNKRRGDRGGEKGAIKKIAPSTRRLVLTKTKNPEPFRCDRSLLLHIRPGVGHEHEKS